MLDARISPAYGGLLDIQLEWAVLVLCICSNLHGRLLHVARRSRHILTIDGCGWERSIHARRANDRNRARLPRLPLLSAFGYEHFPPLRLHVIV